jgi:serine/threonine-protein kinase
MAAKKKIGRYKILGELGRGAMGIVYRAQDPALDRVVALKTIILADDAEGREEYQKRFFLEAKAAGKLTHPSIVTTYDFGEQGGVPYLAMELLEGTDLRTRLKEGALAPIEAVDVARQVAEGLGFAHERGIVHRDVKPGNIMLLERGRAKIMDFGLARMRAADHKTVTGMVLGTPKYMSPEQVAGSPVDQRSDLFSLGIVLFEMLTGARLFGAEDMTQIMHNVTYQEHEPPTRLKPELPAMLDFVVARALKKDPASRYQDAAEFAADLSTCLTELRARGAPAASEPTGTRTVKIERSAEPLSEAPAARAIATDTRLPLARPFDSSAALERLASPSRSDRQRLSRIPKSVGFLRRLTSDDPVRRLFVALVLAAAAGGYIAWG